jgi:hypothetical protein
LLIDPGAEDPARFIEFREEYAVPRNRSVKGRETIRVIGLNRPELRERRLERLRMLITLVECRENLPRHFAFQSAAEQSKLILQLNKIEQLIADIATDDAEYSAMVHTALSWGCGE